MLTPESGRIDTCPLDTADGAADVLIGFREAGVGITSVSVAQPTLDEVFFAITWHGADLAHGRRTARSASPHLEVQ